MARPNIGDLIPIGAVGDAQVGDVLVGKTFSGDAGVGITGTLALGWQGRSRHS